MMIHPATSPPTGLPKAWTPEATRNRRARSWSERRPLQTIENTRLGTPHTTRDALDAVLEAVADVLLMEATIESESTPVREEAPSPWQETLEQLDEIDDGYWWACGAFTKKESYDEPPRIVNFDIDIDYDSEPEVEQVTLKAK